MKVFDNVAELFDTGGFIIDGPGLFDDGGFIIDGPGLFDEGTIEFCDDLLSGLIINVDEFGSSCANVFLLIAFVKFEILVLN